MRSKWTPYAVLAALIAPPASHAGDAAPLLLRSGPLSARVLPAADFHGGVRFDRVGNIDELTVNGHSFVGTLQAANAKAALNPCGPAFEFSPTTPPGYAAAKPGGTFMKIGVGYLQKKDNADYYFKNEYPLINGGDWKIERPGDDTVTVTQTLTPRDGLGCVYSKTLIVGGDSLTIRQSVQNTGNTVIDTSIYCHNFVKIDGRSIGPGYRVDFGFPPEFKARVREPQCVRLDGRSIEIAEPVPAAIEHALYAPVSGFDRARTAHNQMTVALTGHASVTITGDQPLLKLTLYATPESICPEPFWQLHIAPGETARWTTTYQFNIPAN